MNCPRCDAELVVEDHRGIEVDRCHACEGMWLDYHELSELEGKAVGSDEVKGSIMGQTHPSKMACPKCGKQMRKFNYRFYDLELDYCDEEHGFWLDKGEEDRVLQLMQEESRRSRRKQTAEQQWSDMLRKIRGSSFLSRFKR
ncbi:MAG: zf-TFIIB domain-containing protein [Chloroflexota bacterium]|nr:zf-TFIIB domain-containing protein [Chloroflexota bacterium]